MQILYHHRILARDGMRVHIDALTGALERRGHGLSIVGPEADAGEGAHTGLTSRLAGLRDRLPVWTSNLMELGYQPRAYRSLIAAANRRPPDFLYERYNSFLTAGLRLKRRLGIPMLLEVNAPITHERRQLGTLAFDTLAARMEQAVWRGADAVLPVSDALADFLRTAGVAEERITVIPNGVHLENFTGDRDERVKAELGLEGKTVFGFVGFVRAWHGLERVLEVFARHDDPSLHLLIVGEGPASEDLKGRAGALGLSDRLTFTGNRPHEAIPYFLRAVDVALQPDATAYASPLKLFEYMAAGCAIIAPDRPNIREILKDGETALLIDPEAADGLQRALAALAADAELRVKLGRAARAEVERKDYTWDGNARRVEQIAERLLASPGRRSAA